MYGARGPEKEAEGFGDLTSDCKMWDFFLNFTAWIPTKQRGFEKMLGWEERAVGWY